MADYSEFVFSLLSDEVDPEVLDQDTREMLRDLRDQPVESADLVTADSAPAGTKGLAQTLEIAVKVGAPILPIVFEIIKRRLETRGGSVRFEGRIGGSPIKFEGHSREFAQLVATLTGGKTGTR